VAGARYVTVRHPDGLRSSYSYLTTITVREGDLVTGRTVVGRSGARLHLGVRRGDAYLDPAELWGRPAVPLRPVLVPLGGAPVDTDSALQPEERPRTDGGPPGRTGGHAVPGPRAGPEADRPSTSPTATVAAQRAVGLVGTTASRAIAW
jgi:murein DD-endopeptidase MepM/ murein hydrolase activator NlpD